MYPRSQPDAAYGQAPTPKEGVRARLEQLADKAASIHGRADALREHCFGPFPQEAANQLAQTRPSIADLCDSIDQRLSGIDSALEFLLARM